jgi:hypothetical protein
MRPSSTRAMRWGGGGAAMIPEDQCQWFLHCTRRATTFIWHPILKWVRACRPCADFVTNIRTQGGE